MKTSKNKYKKISRNVMVLIVALCLVAGGFIAYRVFYDRDQKVDDKVLTIDENLPEDEMASDSDLDTLMDLSDE